MKTAVTADELSTLNQQASAAARRRMGHFAWPLVLFTGLIALAYSGSIGLLIAGEISLFTAILVCLPTAYFAYTPVHEAVHGNIHGNHGRLKWLNDLCGFVGAQIILISFISHRVEHMVHHRHTNDPRKDPDAMLGDGMRGPAALLWAHWRFIWMQYVFFPAYHWPNASGRLRAAFLLEAGTALAWRLGLLAVLPFYQWLALMVLAYLASIFFLVYWFAYRPHYPYREQGRFRDTRTLLLPRLLKPLEWVWLGQHYHSIHHLYPRVPFYQYGAVLREVEPAMRAHDHRFSRLFERPKPG